MLGHRPRAIPQGSHHRALCRSNLSLDSVTWLLLHPFKALPGPMVRALFGGTHGAITTR